MPKTDETGKCSKCVHSREIAQAKTEAERVRLGKICLSCIRGCKKSVVDKSGTKRVRLCPVNADGKALDRYFKAVGNGETSATVRRSYERLKKECKNCQTKRNCRSDCDRKRTLKELEGLWKCFNCEKCPFTDIMASHGGREVVSIDAAEDPDTVTSLADPLASEPKEDFRDFDERVNEQVEVEDEGEGCSSGNFTSRLSSQVEDALKMEIANFASSLDLVDRELAIFLLNGGTLVEFGRMEWAKKYIKALSRPMTKQAVHGRFKRIVKAMPILKAVAHGTIGKGKGGGAKKPKPKRILQELLFSDDVLNKPDAEEDC